MAPLFLYMGMLREDAAGGRLFITSFGVWNTLSALRTCGSSRESKEVAAMGLRRAQVRQWV